MSWRARAAARAAATAEPWVALGRVDSLEVAAAKLSECVEWALGHHGGPALRPEQGLALVQAVAGWVAPRFQAATRADAAWTAPLLCAVKLAVDAVVAVTQHQDVHLPSRIQGDVFPFLLRASRLQLPEGGGEEDWAFRTVVTTTIRLHSLRALGNLVYVNAEKCMAGDIGVGVLAVCMAHCAGAGCGAATAGARPQRPGTALPGVGVVDAGDDDGGESVEEGKGEGVDDVAAEAGEAGSNVGVGDWFVPPFNHVATAGWPATDTVHAGRELTSATILFGTALTRAGARHLPPLVDKGAVAGVVVALCAHCVDVLPSSTGGEVEENGRQVSACFRLLHALLLCWAGDPTLHDWLTSRSESLGLPRAVHRGMTWGRSGDAAATALVTAVAAAPAGVATCRRGGDKGGGGGGGGGGAAMPGMSPSCASSWYSSSDEEEGEDDDAADVVATGSSHMSWRHGGGGVGGGGTWGGRAWETRSQGSASLPGGGDRERGGGGGGGLDVSGVSHGDDGMWWEINAQLGKVTAADMLVGGGTDGASVASTTSPHHPNLGHMPSTPTGSPLVSSAIFPAPSGASITTPVRFGVAGGGGSVGGRSAGRSRRVTLPSRAKLAIRTRVTALHAITLLARHFPRAILSKWTLFLPEVQGTHPSPWSPSLTTILLYDTSHRVREAAAQALGTMVRATPWDKWLPGVDAGGPGGSGAAGGHHHHLHHLAGGGASKSNLGEKATAAVLEIHAAISRALAVYVQPPTPHPSGVSTPPATITKPSVVAAILQCVCDVAGVTPYLRIAGYGPTTPALGAAALCTPTVTPRQAVNRSRVHKALVHIAHSVYTCLMASHQHVAVSALHSVGALLGSEHAVTMLVLSGPASAMISGGGGSGTPAPPSDAVGADVPTSLLLAVVQCALQHVGTNAAAAMRAEALSVLLRGAKVCTPAFVHAWRVGATSHGDGVTSPTPTPPPSLPHLLSTSLLDTAPGVRAAALRLLEEMLAMRAKALQAGGGGREGDEVGGAEEESAPTSGGDGAAIHSMLIASGWLAPADGPAGTRTSPTDCLAMVLPRALTDPHATVRANALSCMAVLLPADWRVWLAAAHAADGGSVDGRDMALDLFVALGRASDDPAASVRTALCRLLGQCSNEGVWRSPGFSRWVGVLLSGLVVEDDSISVRAKAAWALGNLVSPPNSAPARSLAAALLGETPTVVARATGPVTSTPLDAGSGNGVAGSSGSVGETEPGQWLLPPTLDDALLTSAVPRKYMDAAVLVGAGADLTPGPVPPCHMYRPGMSQSALINTVGLPGVRAITAALLTCVAHDVDKVAGPAVRALGFCIQALVLHWLPLPAAFRDGADPVVASEKEVEGDASTAAGSRVVVRRPVPLPCPDDGLIDAGARQLAHCIAAGQVLPPGLDRLAAGEGDGSPGAPVAMTPWPVAPPTAFALASMPATGVGGAEATKTRWNACHAVCLLLPLAHRMATTHAVDSGSTASVNSGFSGAGGDGPATSASCGGAEVDGVPLPLPPSSSSAPGLSPFHRTEGMDSVVSSLRHAATVAGVQPTLVHSPPRPRVKKETVSGQATPLAGVDHVSTAMSPFLPKVKRLVHVTDASTAPPPPPSTTLGAAPHAAVPKPGVATSLTSSPTASRPVTPSPPSSPAGVMTTTTILVRTVTDCTLPSVTLTTSWLPAVLTALQTAMAAAGNSKVRIAATYALALVPSRQAFRSSPGHGHGVTGGAGPVPSPSPSAPVVDAYPATLAALVSQWRGVYDGLRGGEASGCTTVAAQPAPLAGAAADRYQHQVVAALRVACLHMCALAERSDYSRLKPVLDDAAGFLLQWLETEEEVVAGRGGKEGEGGGVVVEDGEDEEAARGGMGDGEAGVGDVPLSPLPDITIAAVHRVYTVLAAMYASRVKTIPLSLLRRYQAHVPPTGVEALTRKRRG